MSTRATPPRQPLRHHLGLAVPVAALLAAQRAQAAPMSAPPLSEAESVVISTPLCKVEPFSLASFLDSLQVELAGTALRCCTLAQPGDRTPTTASLRVKVELAPCVADADRVQVSVQEPHDSRVVEREVSLADVAQTARPRALALVVAELIRSLERGAPSETPEAMAVPAKRAFASSTPAPTAPSEIARPVALSIHVEGEARGLPKWHTTMWGGRVGFTVHWRILHADLDLGADYARARAELGDVLVRSASAGFGLGPRLATRIAIIDLGLRAELGWAWIRGETRFGDVRTGAGSDLISSVGFRASFEAPAQLKIRPGLALESGGVVRGVNGEVNGHAVVGITGYYLLAALGIAVSL